MLEKEKTRALLENVKYKTLKNGFKIIYIEQTNYSEFYANFSIQYGSNDYSYLKNNVEKNFPYGIAHFMEHMLFNMPYGDAFEKFSNNQASANAYTSHDQTSYLFSTKNNFVENLKILLDMVTTPFFPVDKIKKELLIIKEEIGMYDKDEFYNLYRKSLQSGLEGTGYEHDILGQYDDIKKITKTMLHEVFKDQYTPSNETIVLAGPDLQDAIIFIEEYFDTRNNNCEKISNVNLIPNIFTKQKKIDKEFLKENLNQEYVSISTIFKFEEWNKKQVLQNKIIMQFILDSNYSKISQYFLEAKEKQKINSSFMYELIVENNFIFIAFYETGKKKIELKSFLDSNSLEELKFEDYTILSQQMLGRIFKKFNDPRKIVEFLTTIIKYDVTINEFIEIFMTIKIPDLKIFNEKLQQSKKENIDINFINT